MRLQNQAGSHDRKLSVLQKKRSFITSREDMLAICDQHSFVK